MATVWTRDAIIEALHRWYWKHGRTPTYDRDWGKTGKDHPSSRTAVRVFGSWNAAVEAAELPLFSRNTPLYWTEERIIVAFLDWLLVHGKWPRVRDWSKVGVNHPRECTVRVRFGNWTNAKKAAGWDGKCRSCRKVMPAARADRLWCNAFCRHRGKFVRVVPTCVECGREDLDGLTLGCKACSDRHSSRGRRAA